MVNFNVSTSSLEELNAYIMSPEGQNDLAKYRRTLISELGSSRKWMDACQKAQQFAEQVASPQILLKIDEAMRPLTLGSSPGHDWKHSDRDGAVAVLFPSDPNTQKAAFSVDVLAGVFGGKFHDASTAIVPRYMDKSMKVGHAVASAWIFGHRAKELLPKAFIRLVEYAIGAHQHDLPDDFWGGKAKFGDPITIKLEDESEYKRPTFPYGLYSVPETDGKISGFGPVLTRLADRIEVNGITLVARDLVAEFDAVGRGESSKNLTGTFQYEITPDSVRKRISPVVSGATFFARREEGPASVLRHMQNFANSNNGKNPYSENDKLFTVAKQLLGAKIIEANTLISLSQSAFGGVSSPKELVATKREMHDLLVTVNDEAGTNQNSWPNISAAWDSLTPAEVTAWAPMIAYMRGGYRHQLQTMRYMVSQAAMISPIAEAGIVFLDRLEEGLPNPLDLSGLKVGL